MFITPRLYLTSQRPDQEIASSSHSKSLKFHSITGWQADTVQTKTVSDMLLVHQAGSVRVGEAIRFVFCIALYAFLVLPGVVPMYATHDTNMLFSNRYTVTYTPVTDNVHPLPDALHVKVRNTSAIALRAAYLHGPYTLYASCYPSTFDPHGHSQDEEIEGIPQFEPYLKAGGSWKAMIPIPKCLRQIPETSASPASIQKVTWVIEIISQVIFSTTAIVNYELLIGRDEESVELPYSGGLSVGRLHLAAHLQDHVNPTTKGRQVVATKGVFSKSVCLRIDDTTSLWNTPPFPSEHDSLDHTGSPSDIPPTERESMERAERPDTTRQNCARRKKVHLVVLTHGLHSNLGADMLYLKESIDAATKKTQSGASCKLRQHLAPQAPKGVSSLDR